MSHPVNDKGHISIPIDDSGRLVSDLWYDQEDALAILRRRLVNQDLTAEEATSLRQFADQGYLSFSIDLESDTLRQIESDIDSLWSRRHPDLAYTYIDGPRSMADSVAKRERRPTCRLHDIHSHSRAILDLYLNPHIHSRISSILGRRPIALGSTLTEFGSRQLLVRDAVNVDAPSLAHLLTAWIALDDVTPENGSVRLVPGSHRLPFFRFQGNRISIQEGEDYLPAYRDLMSRIRKARLKETVFTCRRGDVLVRHPGLVHGARPVRDPGATRRILEVYFTVLQEHPRRGGSFVKRVRGRLWRREDRFFWAETDRLLERDGCVGLDNPLRGLDPKSLTLRQKIAARFGSA